MRIICRISSTLRWLNVSTFSPRRTSSAVRSACKSENASTRSGSSATILSNFALMNAETFGFSRASGGRTVYPETPTMRSPWPSRYSVSVVSSVRQTMRLGKLDIGEDEAVTFDDLSGCNRDRFGEHRARVRERVKFAPLSARIDRHRQFVEQRGVEVAACESSIEHFGIHAGEPCLQSALNHLARKPRRVHAEKWKQRSQAGARQFLFAIPPDVFEKQVTKCDMC